MSYNGPVCKAKSVSVAQNGGKRESSVGVWDAAEGRDGMLGLVRPDSCP